MRTLLAMSPRKSPRGAGGVNSRGRSPCCHVSSEAVRSGRQFQPWDLCCAKVGAAINETTMPHRSSDIGFMLGSIQTRWLGFLCILIRYAQERKRAVSNRKWMFHCVSVARQSGLRRGADEQRTAHVGDSRGCAVADTAQAGFSQIGRASCKERV